MQEEEKRGEQQMDTGAQPRYKETAKRPATNQSGGQASNKRTTQELVHQIEEIHEIIIRKHVTRHAMIVSRKVQLWMDRGTAGTGKHMKQIERGGEEVIEEASRQDKGYCN